jgi:hypothetical protein
MSKIKVDDGQVLAVVSLLKIVFGGSKDLRRLLEKIDTPEEIAKIHGAVQSLVDLVTSL